MAEYDITAEMMANASKEQSEEKPKPRRGRPPKNQVATGAVSVKTDVMVEHPVSERTTWSPPKKIKVVRDVPEAVSKSGKTTADFDRSIFALRTVTRTMYDLQKQRISAGNRMVSALRASGVLPPPKSGGKDSNDAVDVTVLKSIMEDYQRVTDVYAEKFGNRGSITKALVECQSPDFHITSELEYGMVRNYMSYRAMELEIAKIVEREVKKHPMWDAFFADVVGCGPLMAAVCLSSFNPYEARHVSSFWGYAGLDVVVDKKTGLPRARNRSDVETKTIVDLEGVVTERAGLWYNPMVKSKLLSVLGGSFLKARRGKYCDAFYDYRSRLQNRVGSEDFTPSHIAKMSIRYSVKLFLADMWVAWRTLEGLPVTEPYAVAMLGRTPHGYDSSYDMENQARPIELQD